MAMASVRAQFEYLQWQELFRKEKPFELFLNIPNTATDARRTNLAFRAHDFEDVEDVRGNERTFELDKHGFQFRRHKSQLDNFSNAQAVESSYLKEVEDLVKREVNGADKVTIFEWRVRLSRRRERNFNTNHLAKAPSQYA